MIKRFEILLKGGKPITYSVDTTSIIVGSSEACHIKIPHRSISRKHLKFSIEGEHFFVTDEGSTNGTYVENERIEAGEKVKVREQQSIRLGTLVLITFLGEAEDARGNSTQPFKITTPLVSDEFPQTNYQDQDEDRTRAISLNTLKKAKTDKLITQREKVLKKKEKQKSGSSENQGVKYLLLFAIIAGGAWYLQQEQKIEEAAIAAPEPFKIAKAEKPKAHESLVKAEELTKKEDFASMLEYPKCENPVEKYLCETLPQTKNFGVVQISQMANVLMDGSEFIVKAEEDLKAYPGESLERDHQRLAAVRFIESLPADFNYEIIKDLNLAFAFYAQAPESEQMVLKFVITMKGSKLQELKSTIREGHFNNLKKIGAVSFKYTDDFFSIY